MIKKSQPLKRGDDFMRPRSAKLLLSVLWIGRRSSIPTRGRQWRSLHPLSFDAISRKLFLIFEIKHADKKCDHAL